MTKRLKLLYCFLCILLGTTVVNAQENLVYNHFYLNPYLYNPAFLASKSYAEVSLNYRAQLPNIQGSANTGTLNLQVPFNFRSAVGVSVVSDQIGAFQTMIGLLSFRHQIFFGQRLDVNHKLSFGLSFGAVKNKIDPSKIDNPDPALANSNTNYFSGQFGLSYQYQRLKIGFAIPQLFEATPSSPEDFSNTKIDKLRNTISTLSYDFALGSKFSFEPFAIYRTTDGLPDQYELMGILKMDDVVWGGGSYRQDYGASVLVGFSLKNNIQLGYAYEFGRSATKSLFGNTHEIQLSIKLGKQKARPERPAPVAEEPVVEEPVAEKPATEKPVVVEPEPQQVIEPVIIVAEPINPTSEPVVKEEVVEPANDPEPIGIDHVVAGKDSPNLKPGHYVVVGVFSSTENAQKLVQIVNRAGYSASSDQYVRPNLYFVYTERLDSLGDAKKLRNTLRKQKGFSFPDAWILSID
jgi:type IX secretion system PorP/SprF family membrane protein